MSSPPPVWQQCREEGNAFFRIGDYVAARQQYTRGIQHNPSEVTLFTNRCLCSMSMNEHQAAFDDAQKATEIAPTSSKAYYLRGKCRRLLGQLDRSLRDFQRGLELCRTASSLVDTGYSDLFDAYFAARGAQFVERREEQMLRCREALDECAKTMQGASHHHYEQLESLFTSAAAFRTIGELRACDDDATASGESPSRQRGDLPDCFICPITLDVMRDPVILVDAASGSDHGFASLVEASFERTSVLEHFRVNGWTHPVTRAALRRPLLISNVSLRNAIYQYLMDHPWVLYRPNTR